MEHLKMKYRTLGNSGIDVSVIGHGTWPLGNDFFGNVDENVAVRAIHASLDNGVNLIDTAAAYGEDGASEKVVGKAIKGRRTKVVLATKVGVLRFFGQNYVKCLDPNVMRIELERSLKRLGTDFIDLYQIHWPDANSGIESGLCELVKMKSEGKIRAIGVSNFTPAQIRTAVELADIASVQPSLSLLDRKSLEDGVIAQCVEMGVGVLSYGSLGGGILAGKVEALPIAGNELRAGFYGYYAEPMLSKCRELVAFLQKLADKRGAHLVEVSVNWVLAQKGITSALIGATTPEKAVKNTRAPDWELTNEELVAINDEYARIML
jgi:aryl-alcohol dehydrogenase-like predicted oxidoreductase